MTEQRWATERLVRLAAHLTPAGIEMTPLLRAGVSYARIASLYPFALEDWQAGITELTQTVEAGAGADPRDAWKREVASLITNSWVCVGQLANVLDKSSRTKEMGEAWAAATDDRNPTFTPHVLTFTILLLDALARGRAQPKDTRLDKMTWAELLPVLREDCDRLVELLDQSGWKYSLRSA